MKSSEYLIIRSAIQNRQQIHAIYSGHKRLMCPHTIGTKKGKEQALFYQFGGTSSSGQIVPNSPDNWRCLPIEKLSGITAVEGDWYTGANHSRAQTCVDIIDLEYSR